MARRDRTTGLPRPRPRQKTSTAARFAGITWDERNIRNAIVGAAVALLVIVLGAFSYQLYQDHIARPRSTVLAVDGIHYKLSYYADRLPAFLQANQQSQSVALIEEGLLTKLEEEALTILAGRDNGISLSYDDVTKAIADDFGVPVGGTGSSFDTLYRQRLKTQNISDGSYRKQAEAAEVNKRLLAKYTADLGDSGELVTLRVVLSNSQDAAQKVFDRIKGGEDMGAIAQTESLDLESRQQDGKLPADPEILYPDAVRAAMAGKGAGELLGPIKVESNYWVIRIESRDTQPYSETQKTQVAQTKLDDAIKAKRSQVKIDRSLDPDDIKWAEGQVK